MQGAVGGGWRTTVITTQPIIKSRGENLHSQKYRQDIKNYWHHALHTIRTLRLLYLFTVFTAQ